MRSEPQRARTLVWALSISLAATLEIDVSFSSSGYLDVSVHRVPFRALWIGARIHRSSLCGFPHSEICGSTDMCSSPQLIAAYHVFHRLLVPRHPPCALFAWPVLVSILDWINGKRVIAIRLLLYSYSLQLSYCFNFCLLLDYWFVFSDVLIIWYFIGSWFYQILMISILINSLSVWSFQGTSDALGFPFALLAVFHQPSMHRTKSLRFLYMDHKWKTSILFFIPAASCFSGPSPAEYHRPTGS